MKNIKFLLSLAVFTFTANTLAAGQIPGVMPVRFDISKLEKKGKPMIGQLITIDTRDPQTCQETRELLDPKKKNKYFDSLCEKNDERPYSTILIVNPPEEEASGVLYTFNEDDMIHANNARNVVVLGMFAVGRFLAQGYDDSGWKNPGSDPGRAYYKNITRAPVIDKDDFRTNFIEHPISGAAYYTIARHSGFSAWESFGFSVFSSTFLWEYGLEAIFERPSINDLIVTPVLGSLIGELLYQISERIAENDGKVLGSRTLGFIAQGLTSPGLFFSALINQAIGADWFKEGDIGWVVRNRNNRPYIQPMSAQTTSKEIALRLRLKF